MGDSRPFHQQNFKQRFGTMGDPAEARFDEIEPRNHRLGLNRPPFSMAQMDPMLRYLPDRMTKDCFVEVMGIGKDGTLKLKVEKIAALFQWQAINDVDLFVSSSYTGETWRAPIEDWLEAIVEHAAVDIFPEGKKFVALHSSLFPPNSQIGFRNDQAA